MAPSPPELGQPKAPPDKGDSKVIINDDSTDNNPKESSNNPKSGSGDSDKKIAKMDEQNLKALLDEALSYKKRSDLQHKSEMFKELLKSAEREDQAHDTSLRNVHPKRNSGRHTHGGSLQDLVVSDYNIDFGVSHTKKHNSRQKKYSSSVSSRQREGGSLPSNVNESASPYIGATTDLFPNTINKTYKNISNQNAINTWMVPQTHHHQYHQYHHQYHQHEKNYLNIDESPFNDLKSIGINSNHTVIDIGDTDSEETKHLLTEPIQNSISQEEGTELKKFSRIPQQHYTTQVQISVNDSNSNNIDAVVKIPIEKTKLIDNLEPIYTSTKYNEILEPRQPVTKIMTTSIPNCPLTSREENGNSISMFNSSLTSTNALVHNTSNQTNKIKAKNKQSKADRNTVVIKAGEVAGHQSEIIHDIDALMQYIENTTDKNHKKSLILKEDEKNKKNKNSSNNNNTANGNSTKKEKNLNNRLKRCNSLEELSTSRNDDSVVNLRQKTSQKKSNPINGNLSSTITTITTTTASTTTTTTTTSSSNMDAINNNKIQTKRGERRSWGTEELNYLGDTCKIEEVKSNKTIVKSNNNNISNNNSAEVKDCNLFIKKKDSLSIVSIESISTSSETAEFHVVTKKKKTKKKSQNIFNDDLNIQNNNNKNNNYYSHNITLNRREHYNNFNTNNNHSNNRNQGKYHSQNSNFTNDREVYMNHSFKKSSAENNNSRRKSTSSVPPSEKSDTSDLDSVHSLPVESSSLKQSVRQQSTSSGGTPQASYADIAKIVNTNSNNINNNNNNNQLNNNYIINTQYDKWPSVSKTSGATLTATTASSATPQLSSISSSSSSSSSTVRATTPVKNSSSNNTTSHTCNNLNCKGQNSTKTSKSSCTELLVDNNNISYVNNNNNINNNLNSKLNDTNNNSNNSSSNNKLLTYSQSLIDDNKNVSVNKQQLMLKSQSASFQQQLNHTANNNNSDGLLINTKQPIQKSKSVDNNDNFYNSIEQYPALEKTVKVCPKTTIEFKSKNGVNKSICSSPITTTVNINNNSVGVPIKHEKKSKTNTLETSTQSFDVLETINNSKNKLLNSDFDQSPSNEITKKQNDKIPSSNSTDQNKTNSIMNDLVTNNNIQNNTITTNNKSVSKRNNKKDKSQSNSSPASALSIPNTKTINSSGNVTNNQNTNNRPAVIILNDNEPKSHDFTFGFDIDKNLLFGDFNELLDEPSDQSFQISGHNNSINTSPNSNDNNNSNINVNMEISSQSDLGYLSISTSSTTASEPLCPNSSLIDSTNKCNKNNLNEIVIDSDVPKESESVIVSNTPEKPITTVNTILSKPPSTGPTSSQTIPITSITLESVNSVIVQNGNTSKDAEETVPKNPTDVDKQPESKVKQPVKKIEKFVSPVIDKVHFVAPESLSATINYDIVNFVGIAWEDVICGSNHKYYNDGQ